jgi:hypothetical protein
MAIRHLKRLLALPLLVFPFLIGWGLYVVGSSKNQGVTGRAAKYAENFDLRFGLLMQEEQYAK